MNFAGDEPRKVPQPVPFSQNSTFHPTVPEVSLILQEPIQSVKMPSKDSFSSAVCQTYNAWKWKTINEKEKEIRSYSKNQDLFPINDKFSGSDIERRKNQILYGNFEEPRRPLPPRQEPIIPQYDKASFSEPSFTSEQWNSVEIKDHDKNYNLTDSRSTQNFNAKRHEITPDKCRIDGNDLNDIKNLYQIITEQNKQTCALQKQIDQLLKSQTTKEKQIEQLLKSHIVKENKIEHLLKLQDMKENRIEQLLKTQEKYESQIQKLIHYQETKNIEKNNSFKCKESVTIGLMAKVDTADKSTNISMHCCCKKEDNTDSKSKTEDENIRSRFGNEDKSFTLHSLDLPLVQEQIPTPQSSIHVDIPEYIGSSDEESDNISSQAGTNACPVLDSKPLGYTFYNKLLMQVNDIIHSNSDQKNEEAVLTNNMYDFPETTLQEKNTRENCLKEHNVELQSSTSPVNEHVEKLWGIDIYDENQADFQCRANIASRTFKSYGINKQSPSDISLKMNALALKYLKQEQLSQYEIDQNRQPDVTIYNVTNLSFGTMRYLERYKITSNKFGGNNECIHSPHKFLQRKAKEDLKSSVSKFSEIDLNTKGN